MNPEHSSPDDPAVAELLSGWSKRGDPSPSRAAGLRDRIVKAFVEPVHSARSAVEPAPQAGPSSAVVERELNTLSAGEFSLRQRYSRRVAELIACCALAAVWFWLRPVPRAAIEHQSAGDLLAATGGQQRQQAELFGAFQEIFSERLGWVVDSSGSTLVGLFEGETRDAAAPLGVRVALVRRARGSTTWELAWTADVLTATAQPVQPRPQSDSGSAKESQRIEELWTYRLPDGMVYVESRVRLPGNGTAAEPVAGLLALNRPTLVANLQDVSADYRVYQTVARIDVAGVGP